MIPSETEIRAFLPLPIKKTGNHLICTCPICNKQLHCYCNIKTGMWDCKKCASQGNLYSFLKAHNKLELLQGAQINYTEVLKPLYSNLTDEPVDDLEIPDIKLPGGFKVIKYTDNNKYAKYLRDRKYTVQDFESYRPGYTDLYEKYSDYIIIPLQRDFTVKGFVARNILKDDRPRYQNKKGVKFSHLLDGYDEITSATAAVILTEGHFDKVSVTTELKLHEDDNIKALATFGKKISDAQISLLRRTKVRDIYLCWDTRDAINDIKSSGLRLSKYFFVQGCYTTTGRDPGDMNDQEIIEMLGKAESIRDFANNKVQTNKLK